MTVFQTVNYTVALKGKLQQFFSSMRKRLLWILLMCKCSLVVVIVVFFLWLLQPHFVLVKTHQSWTISSVCSVVTSSTVYRTEQLLLFQEELVGKKAESTTKHPLIFFDVCRQPEHGKMICCTSCQEWFHKGCVKTPAGVWKQKDIKWYCTKCLK